MAILNFKKQFASKVRRGLKRQTIRAFRKYPIEFGERLYLYTGLRTKFAKRLRAAAYCIGTRRIEITEKGVTIFYQYSRPWKLKGAQLDRFAVQDGFKNWSEMRAFWLETHSLPFEGTLIKWIYYNPVKSTLSKP